MTGIYAVMKDDVTEVIAAEQKRSSDLYDALRKPGHPGEQRLWHHPAPGRHALHLGGLLPPGAIADRPRTQRARAPWTSPSAPQKS